jgi:hypothetical protein
VLEPARALVEKALKFARSYARGLFKWRKAKLPWHNNGTEVLYHQKKGKYRRGSPNMAIGTTLELSAPEEMFVPLDLTEETIAATLDWVGTAEYWQVRGAMKGRSARRAFERRCRDNITSVLDVIFAKLNE